MIYLLKHGTMINKRYMNNFQCLSHNSWRKKIFLELINNIFHLGLWLPIFRFTLGVWYLVILYIYMYINICDVQIAMRFRTIKNANIVININSLLFVILVLYLHIRVLLVCFNFVWYDLLNLT